MADTIRTVEPDAAPAARAPGSADPGTLSVAAPSVLRRSGPTTADLLRALLDDKVVLVALCFILLIV